MKDHTTILRRVLLLACLLLLGITGFLVQQPSVRANAPHEQQRTTATPSGTPEAPPFAVFPATDTMTDTINSVATALAELPQPPLPPPDALLAEDAALASAAPAKIIYLTFVPLVQRSVAPAPAPDPTATATATPTRTPTATPRPDPEPRGSPADVAVTLWPSPSIRAARNSTLAYEVRLANYGDGDASSVRVTLPYPRDQLILVNSRFERNSDDWVSAVNNKSITVTFGRLEEDERRKGTIYLRVRDNLPNDTVISMRARFAWDDRREGGDGATNWTPVLVGGNNDNATWAWMAVDPLRGGPGTTHRFFTDRFLPDEGVVAWLNTPDGVKALDLRTTADGTGRVWLNFSSRNRSPGNYQLVVYGTRSKLTAVGTFIVQ